jgi:hypothetical protein
LDYIDHFLQLLWVGRAKG